MPVTKADQHAALAHYRRLYPADLDYEPLEYFISRVDMTSPHTRMHLAVEALVLSPDQDRVLHHRQGGARALPGGHLCERDTTLVGAAARHILTSTGLSGDHLAIRHTGPVLLRHAFAPAVPGEDGPPGDHHHLVCTVLFGSDVIKWSSRQPGAVWRPLHDLSVGLCSRLQFALSRRSARAARAG